MNKTGLIVDVDDTLAETAKSCIEMVAKDFPETLGGRTVAELIQTYQQPGNVPAWQNIQIQQKIHDYLTNERFLLSVEPVWQSRETLNKIVRKIPVEAYLTSRSVFLKSCTISWLVQRGYPPARVVARAAKIKRPDWKLRYIATYYPNSWGLIDDNWRALFASEVSYDGKLVIFNRYEGDMPETLEAKRIWFNDWEEIGDYVLRGM